MKTVGSSILRDIPTWEQVISLVYPGVVELSDNGGVINWKGNLGCHSKLIVRSKSSQAKERSFRKKKQRKRGADAARGIAKHR